MKIVVIGSEVYAGRHALLAMPGALAVASDGDIEPAVAGADAVLLCSVTWDSMTRLRMGRALHPLAARVLLACRRGGARRLVHLSTTLVYGLHHPAGTRLSESSRPRPAHAYERLKLLEEELLREGAGDVEVVIVRAALGFGAHDQVLARMLEDLERGSLRLAGGGRAMRGFLAGPDLGRVLAAAAGRGRAGATYLAAGFEGSWQQLIGMAAHVLGTRSRVLGVPYDVAYLGAALRELRTPAGQACWPGTLHVDIQARPHLYDGGRTRQELVWSPQVGSFEEGVMELAAWYRSLAGSPPASRPMSRPGR